MTAIVVGSSNAAVGIESAMAILRQDGSAVDAVVAAIKHVEANPEDHSVGYAGLPNLLGEVELDASLMDGRNLATGAVGALHGYQDAIALAKHVMDQLPHVLIVGAGADRFAGETGLTPTDLLTPEAERVWRDQLESQTAAQRYGRQEYFNRVKELATVMTRDPERPEESHGTTNVIALDRAGNLACGVSTSGWAWKYPGRLGDSPIIGAGNYADNRWGAAACTGRGEMAQRCCTAHSVVTFLRFGLSLPDALDKAMQDLLALDDPYASEINIVALTPDGTPGAASSSPDKPYIFMRDDMTTYETAIRTHITRRG